MLQSVDLALVVEAAPTAVVVVDGNGRIHLVNQQLERLFGYTREELMNQPVETLLPARYHTAHPALRKGFSMEPQARPMGTGRDLRARRKDGTEFYVEVGLSPVQTHDGTFIIGAVVDITARKLVEEELKAARDVAETAGRAKGEFLATMSHEIRTPMNGIIGMANVLLGTELDSEQHDYAATILGSAQSLLKILNDVLDYSKVEAGRLEIEPFEFDLLIAAEELIGLLATRAAETGLELLLRYSPSLPRRVLGDEGRIRQVMMNLVGNALKFTERGHVLLEIGGALDEAGDVKVEFVIEDTGIGIPFDKQKLLFSRFTQADSSMARRFGGSGLGLAISKRLVELMGGSIGMESKPGKGSRFHFSLTLPCGTAVPDLSLRERRILVADNVDLSRDALVDWLRGNAAQADGERNGMVALRKLSFAALGHEPYHAAIIGSELEDCSGTEFARAIAASQELQDLRLIAWLAAGKYASPAAIRAAGFEGQLQHPCRYSRLYELLAPAVQPAPTVAPPGSDDPCRARVLLVEDNPVNQRVATYALMKLGCAVDVACDGREALERWEKATYDLILMDCHMPVMDGYEATRTIRKKERGSHVPIVAITASAMTGEREYCEAAGMDDYITKPLGSNDLKTSLERWVPRKPT